MEIHFILFKPAVPGNVGASARAIKTMGFRHLILIDPCDHLGEEALMMAHGSHDLLQSARLSDTFEEATSGLDLIVATTARERTAKHDYHTVRDLAEILRDKESRLERVGIIFGTEESGLPNKIVLQSDLAVTVPMASGYPSLNLAQAVMVTAYELSFINPLFKPGKPISKSGEGFGELKKQVNRMLLETGIPEGSPLYHRIMERMALVSSTDIPLFLSVISRLHKK